MWDLLQCCCCCCWCNWGGTYCSPRKLCHGESVILSVKNPPVMRCYLQKFRFRGLGFMCTQMWWHGWASSSYSLNVSIRHFGMTMTAIPKLVTHTSLSLPSCYLGNQFLLCSDNCRVGVWRRILLWKEELWLAVCSSSYARQSHKRRRNDTQNILMLKQLNASQMYFSPRSDAHLGLQYICVSSFWFLLCLCMCVHCRWWYASLFTTATVEPGSCLDFDSCMRP